MRKIQHIVTTLLCAAMLTTLAGCTTTPKRETAGQYVDDSVITTKVKAAIFDEIALKSFQIKVTTFQGVVQLSGFVDSAENARKAGEIARNVQGVNEVKNDLIPK